MTLDKAPKKINQDHKKNQLYLFETTDNELSKKLKSKKISGYEIGRLMIMDLVDIKRKSLGLETTNDKILDAKERAKLVSSLVSQKDILEYNELRNTHDYLVRTSILSELYSQYASIEALKLINPLINLQRGEAENSYLLDNLKENAVILKHLKRYSLMAEDILEDEDLIKKAYEKYQINLKELFILKEAVKIIGGHLDIEEMEILVSAPNYEYHDILNELMATLPPLIVRWGRYEDEQDPISLQDRLKKLFKPIDINFLKPESSLIEKAKKNFDLKLVQGNEQILYDMLRN